MPSEIEQKYQALGGETGSVLGPPISTEGLCPDGQGRFRHYERGSIYWHPNTGAHEVHGRIHDKWRALGWEKSRLGYPKADERETVGGRFSQFQGGVILWKVGTEQAFEVHGDILRKYVRLLREKGFLGYPLTGETRTPDGVGRFNHFEHGSIYWHPSNGAYEVHGFIREKWGQLGWEQGLLGYPVSDEQRAPDGDGRFNDFEHGSISWHPTDGIRVKRDVLFPTYELRIQAVACADDDGSNAATATVGVIQSQIAFANLVFASAGVTFVFDPATDFLQVNSTLLNRQFTLLDEADLGTNKWSHEPRKDSAAHDRAREQLGKLFSGKVVVLYRARTVVAEVEDGDTTYWVHRTAGGYSGGESYCVNLPSSGGGLNLLAHEVGHYLQLDHPFVEGVSTVADAAEMIRKYVEDKGHPTDEGLNALDGDRHSVLDTPSDAAGSIFADAGVNSGDKCGVVGEIPIPVTFTDGSEQTYTLAPDRSLIMSYFKGCPWDMTVSPEQGVRVRDGLEQGIRHPLISMERDIDYQIVRRAEGTAGAVSDLDMVMVRCGWLATAVRDSSGELKLIAWGIANNGSKLIRRGSANAGKILQVAACSMGLNMVATAVRVDAGTLKVIVWKVDEDGNVIRKGSAVASGSITDLAVCRLGIRNLVTVGRRTNGDLLVSVWEVAANGDVVQRATDATVGMGSIFSTRPPCGLAVSSLDKGTFATYSQDSSRDLTSIVWRYRSGSVSRLGSASVISSPGVHVAGCAMDRDVSVAAAGDDRRGLQLAAVRFRESGELIQPGGTASAGSLGALSACRMGTGLLVTAVRTREGTLKLILWDVSDDGGMIVRRVDVATEDDINLVSACYAGVDLFATAVRDGSGNLKVVLWRVRTPFSGMRLHGNYARIAAAVPRKAPALPPLSGDDLDDD